MSDFARTPFLMSRGAGYTRLGGLFVQNIQKGGKIFLAPTRPILSQSKRLVNTFFVYRQNWAEIFTLCT